MRMAIEATGGTMSSPASMCNPSMTIKHLLEVWGLVVDELPELIDLAYFLER
jgi:hypothetical protein